MPARSCVVFGDSALLLLLWKRFPLCVGCSPPRPDISLAFQEAWVRCLWPLLSNFREHQHSQRVSFAPWCPLSSGSYWFKEVHKISSEKTTAPLPLLPKALPIFGITKEAPAHTQAWKQFLVPHMWPTLYTTLLGPGSPQRAWGGAAVVCRRVATWHHPLGATTWMRALRQDLFHEQQFAGPPKDAQFWPTAQVRCLSEAVSALLRPQAPPANTHRRAALRMRCLWPGIFPVIGHAQPPAHPHGWAPLFLRCVWQGLHPGINIAGPHEDPHWRAATPLRPVCQVLLSPLRAQNTHAHTHGRASLRLWCLRPWLCPGLDVAYSRQDSRARGGGILRLSSVRRGLCTGGGTRGALQDPPRWAVSAAARACAAVPLQHLLKDLHATDAPAQPHEAAPRSWTLQMWGLRPGIFAVFYPEEPPQGTHGWAIILVLGMWPALPAVCGAQSTHGTA